MHQRDRLLCQDCRVILAADCGSDHRLVCASLKLPRTRFDHRPSTAKHARFDVCYLRPSVNLSPEKKRAAAERQENFKTAVTSALTSTCSQEGNGDLETVEEQWCHLRDSLIPAGKQHLGYVRRRDPDWFTDNYALLYPLLENRRLCYNRWVASQQAVDYSRFKSARSKAGAAVRRAKNDWLASVAQQTESHSNGGAVWSAIRSIQHCFRGLRPSTSVALKKADGELCKSADEISDRWQQHFTNVLNIESNFDSSVFDSLRVRPVREDLASLPTSEELSQAVARLSNNKAAGETGILPEMVRYGGDAFSDALLTLVHKVWSVGVVPQAWRDAELVPIPKRGDLTCCDNWRGIALLDVIGKVVGRVIQSRLQMVAEEELADSQCGFRKGRSCTDHIFSVTQLVEKCYEHRTPACLIFIDLRKAYDSVSRAALWRGLEIMGVPPSLVQLISSFHSGMTAKVRVGSSHTGSIPVNNGLRQGCSMAPVLFNLFFELVLETWRMEMDRAHPRHQVEFRYSINGNLFNGPRSSCQDSSAPDLEFADDALLITPSRTVAHLALSTFAAVATSFGLSVNFVKTKIMPCGVELSCEDQQPFNINCQTVHVVDSFVYLGSLLSPDSRCGTEVDRRLASAAKAFGALQCVFRDKNLSIRTKRLVYSACILSTLLYGSECWPILRSQERRLDSFHHQCLRAILGVSRLSQQLKHISNAELRSRWGDVGLISDTLRKRRLRWLGHVARMPEDRLPKQLFFGWLPRTRPAHGPRLRWKDRIAADLKNLQVNSWYTTAQARVKWRVICHSLPDPPPTSSAVQCTVCLRSFKSQSGLSRHKCRAERELPVNQQPGARQCSRCERWFRSAGGLAVHKCVQQETPCVSRTATTGLQCCLLHCATCSRCFRSKSGFTRHNCHRGRRRTSDDPAVFEHCCPTCDRQFRRSSDLKRHKCRT